MPQERPGEKVEIDALEKKLEKILDTERMFVIYYI